jgi:hypothetical protein
MPRSFEGRLFTGCSLVAVATSCPGDHGSHHRAVVSCGSFRGTKRRAKIIASSQKVAAAQLSDFVTDGASGFVSFALHRSPNFVESFHPTSGQATFGAVKIDPLSCRRPFYAAGKSNRSVLRPRPFPLVLHCGANAHTFARGATSGVTCRKTRITGRQFEGGARV